MKKLLFCLLLILCLGTFLMSCGKQEEESTPEDPQQEQVEEFTVAFEVDGQRVKTLKVEKGKKIAATVADPSKSGFEFLGWYIGEEKIDLANYVVNSAVTLVAKFKEVKIDVEVDVNAQKEEGKEYYLVVGWWETTAIDSETGEPKHTSYMDEARVKMFYSNLVLYLKAKGATDEDIANIQIRNYSSEKVAEMGAAVLADGDVDLMIGVGNNVNSQAGLSLYEGSNDNKFETNMGQANRYVALLDSTNELGINVFDWLRTDTGRQAFLKVLAQNEITVVPERSDEINLSVTVHGNENKTTLLDDAEDVVEMPEITVPEGKEFAGFAKAEGGEVVLNVAMNAELKFANLKTLINVGDTELGLWPVFKDKVEVERTSYAVIAWYNKEGTSGLNETIMETVEAYVKAYLVLGGVSMDDINTIVIRPYEGTVAPSTDAILEDGDVDIMIGWGSVSNITETGHIPAAKIVSSMSGYQMGAKSGRWIHVLSDDQSVASVALILKTIMVPDFMAPITMKLGETEVQMKLNAENTNENVLYEFNLTETELHANDELSFFLGGEAIPASGISLVSGDNNKVGEGLVLTQDILKANISLFVGVDGSTSLLVVDSEASQGGEGGEEEPPVATKYLVIGWWETTAVDSETGEPKHTSYLTEESVNAWLANLKLFLKSQGASDEDLAKVELRNYSSAKVAAMGAAVLADGDVDLMIGVGNNVNTDGGLTLYNSSSDYKFKTNMGQAERFVALLSSSNELGLKVFEWLQTELGKSSFLEALTEEDFAEEEELDIPQITFNDVAVLMTKNENPGYGATLEYMSEPLTLVAGTYFKVIFDGDVYPADGPNNFDFDDEGLFIAVDAEDARIYVKYVEEQEQWQFFIEGVKNYLDFGYQTFLYPVENMMQETNKVAEYQSLELDLEIYDTFYVYLDNQKIERIGPDGDLETNNNNIFYDSSDKSFAALNPGKVTIYVKVWEDGGYSVYITQPAPIVDYILAGDSSDKLELVPNDDAEISGNLVAEYFYNYASLKKGDEIQVYLNEELITNIGPDAGENNNLDADMKIIKGGEVDICVKVWNDGGYSVFVSYPEPILNILIQVSSKLSSDEAFALGNFLGEWAQENGYHFMLLAQEQDAAGLTSFISEQKESDIFFDIVIGGNNPLKNYALYNATQYPLANVTGNHFADTSRKIVILAESQYPEIAIELYQLLTAVAE